MLTDHQKTELTRIHADNKGTNDAAKLEDTLIRLLDADVSLKLFPTSGGHIRATLHAFDHIRVEGSEAEAIDLHLHIAIQKAVHLLLQGATA